MFDMLIVGAGCAGTVCAERLANAGQVVGQALAAVDHLLDSRRATVAPLALSACVSGEARRR